MSYVELFSGHAGAYAAARPRYPGALFEWLAAIAARRDLAWDCATGNGQAALGLAEHFARVIATDASAAQLAHAEPHPRIVYRQAAAEASGLESASVDLIAVAQALHWFDLRAFYAEAGRVVAPGGVLAAWTYNRPRVTPAIDRAVDALHDDTLGTCWADRRQLVDAGYATLAFPFEAIEPPPIRMHTTWTLAEFTAYVRTWSAVRRYLGEHGRDPVDALEYELRPLWGEPHERRPVDWPLSIRASRAPSAP